LSCLVHNRSPLKFFTFSIFPNVKEALHYVKCILHFFVKFFLPQDG